MGEERERWRGFGWWFGGPFDGWSRREWWFVVGFGGEACDFAEVDEAK